MKLLEVEELFFKYEEKRHEFLQKTQQYYLKRKFQPYVWMDEDHNLRIKQKYNRKTQKFQNTKRKDFIKTTEEFAEQNDLYIRFITDIGETDKTLPQDVQTQWSTEIILKRV